MRTSCERKARPEGKPPPRAWEVLMKSRLYKAQAPSELSGQRVMDCDDANSGWFILRLLAGE
jgi:hypothetical protein